MERDGVCENGLGTTSQHAEESAGEVLKTKEAAALARLTTSTLRKRIRDGSIPGVRRIGGVYRIVRRTFLEWLQAGRGDGGSQ